MASREILSLVSVLRSGKVKERRDADKRLRERLKDITIRTQIEREAAAGSNKRKALTTLWDTVLKSALYAGRQAVSSGKKVEKNDIDLPYYLLVCCPLQYVQADLVNELVDYSLKMYTEDKATDVAKADLVAMLEFICSKRDIVCFLDPDRHLHPILTEIQVMLEADEQDLLAAKAFASLVATCEEIGFGMELFFPHCMEMVRIWSKTILKESAARLPQNFKFMIGAAATLMTAYPELAATWMSKRGKSILTIAKRNIAKASDIEFRGPLIRYFMAHLMVNETAGRLEGKLPGDFGNLGHASLDENSIRTLLETEMGRLTSATGLASFRNQIRGKREQAMDLAEAERERGGLELCARLLACLQRLYMVDAEWKSAKPEDRTKWLLSKIPAVGADPAEKMFDVPSPSPLHCSYDVIAGSPWYEFVAKPLLQQESSAVPEVRASASQELGEVDIEMTNSEDATELQHLRESIQQSQTPGSSQSKNVSKASPIALLKLICACGELFPLGECWSSSARDDWHALDPSDPVYEDKRYCKGCAMNDMAFVVHQVADILESCGGPQGAIGTQIWALLCLVRLTEASALVTHGSLKLNKPADTLSAAWQRVWSVLFRTDLRFVSYTGAATQNSVGELVLILLTEIVRQGCTNTIEIRGLESSEGGSQFLCTQQEQIWQLPAFRNGEKVNVSAAFELIGVVLQHVGLNEAGRDVLERKGPGVGSIAWSKLDESLRSKRRLRLLCFCLQFVERGVYTGDCIEFRDIYSAAAACITMLVSGEAVLFSTSFEVEGSIDQTWQSSCDGEFRLERSQRFSVVLSRPSPSLSLQKYGQGNETTYFQCLWTFSALPEFKRYDCAFEDQLLSNTLTVDFARLLLRERDNLRRENANAHADFVSSADSLSMKEFVTSSFEELLTEWLHPTTDSNLPIASATFVAKLLLTALLPHTNGRGSPENDVPVEYAPSIERALASVLGAFVSTLSSQPENCCSLATTDVLQVLYSLRKVQGSRSHRVITETLHDKLSLLYEECELQMEAFAEEGFTDDHSAHGEHDASDEDDRSERRKSTSTRAFSSDESEDDYEYSAPVRKRRSGASDESSRRSIKRRRRSDQSASLQEEPERDPPGKLSAFRIASMMVLLRPSLNVCRSLVNRLVFRSLEEPEDATDGESSAVLDTDSACHCLNLFVSEALVLHRELEDLPGTKIAERADESVVAQIVTASTELIQRMRTMADSRSTYYTFCYSVCSDLSHLSISTASRNQIVDTLAVLSSKLERNNFKLRSKARAHQLKSATAAYRHGQDRFRKKFAEKFAANLILPSLRHEASSVRVAAGIACGSLRSLEQGDDAWTREIIANTIERLAPLSDEEAYLDWCGRDNRHTSPDSDDDWSDMWLIERPWLELFSISCRALVAQAGSDHEKKLFDLVSFVGKRPEANAVCFHACEKLSAVVDCTKADAMISAECEYLALAWLRSGRTIADIPILMSASGLLEEVLRSGQTLGLDLFREEAARKYTEKMAHVILPCLLTQCCERSPAEEMDDSEREYFVRMDKAVKDLYGFINECNGSRVRRDQMGELLRDKFHDIYAFIEPLKLSGKESVAMTASRVSSFIQEELTPENRKTFAQESDRTVRRLLQLWGNNGHSYGEERLSESSVTETINSLAVQRGRDDDSHAMFQRVGGSFSEFLLHANYWLYTASTRAQVKRRWQVLEWVVRTFREELSTNAKSEGEALSLCIHVLLDTLLTDTLESIQTNALNLLGSVLGRFLRNPSSVVKGALESNLPLLVKTMLAIHNSFQESVVSDAFALWFEKESKSRIGRGLAPRQEQQGAWGWDAGMIVRSPGENVEDAVGSFQVDSRRSELLKGTYSVVRTLWDHLNTIGGNIDFSKRLFEMGEDTMESRALCRKNEEYCAQDLVKELRTGGDGRGPNDSPDLEIAHFLSLSKGPQGTESSVDDNTGAGTGSLSKTTIRTEILVDSLRRLQKCAIQRTNVGKAALDDTKLCLLSRKLVDCCRSQNSKQVRFEACKCLGALGPDTVQRVSSFELGAFISNSVCKENAPGTLVRIKASCLEMMADYILSSRTEVALTAFGTIKALIAEEGSTEWLTHVSNENRRLYLASLKADTEGPVAPRTRKPHETESHDDDLVSDEAPQTCWNKELWTCRSDEEYRNWVCELTSALLKSCYSDKQRLLLDRSKTLEPDPFFRHCIRICAEDSDIATCLFPGIILDLLLRSHDAPLSSTESFGDFFSPVQEDTWIGHPKSLINQRLSESFTHVLLMCTSNALIDERDDGLGTDSQHSARSNVISTGLWGKPVNEMERSTASRKAAILLLDALDLLRRTSQQQFLNSKEFGTNLGPAPSRTYPDGKDKSKKLSHSSLKEYNQKGLPEAAKWDGVPYGVVLRIDGLVMVQACIFVGKYASALFYSEMYSDKMGKGHESNARFRTPDISGFLPLDENEPWSPQRDEGAFLGLLETSFASLNEEGAAEAMRDQSAALRFMDSSFQPNTDALARHSDLDRLRLLDARVASGKHPKTSAFLVANCMDKLGLRNVLRVYAEGIAARLDRNGLEDLSLQEIRSFAESFHSGTLTELQWGNLPSAVDTSELESVGLLPSTNEHFSFCKSLASAFGSFLREDVDMLRRASSEAHSSVVNELCSLTRGEYSLSAIVNPVEKMQVLNDVDQMGDSGGLITVIAEELQRLKEEEIMNLSDGLAKRPVFREFSAGVREIVLRSLNMNAPQADTTSLLLSRHLEVTASQSCLAGRYDLATSSLLRLRTLLTDQSTGELDRLKHLDLRLREASVMEGAGDFTEAIRYAEKVCVCLREYEDSPLHVRALLQCGSWMAQRKLQNPTTIREHFIEYAVKTAKKIHERAKTNESRRSLASAHLSLGDLASAAYNSSSSLVSSAHFTEVDNDLKRRKQNLEANIAKRDSLHATLSSPQNKKMNESEQAEYSRLHNELNEIHQWVSREQKDISNIEREHEAEREAAANWRILALQSWCDALCIADAAEARLSPIVFRLISLWFANPTGEDDDAAACNVMKVGVHQIPTFFFVPLASQILPRIGNEDRTGFDDLLDELVKRMCSEHPYHCIMPLIALENMNVRTGMSGESLYPTNSSKAGKAHEILQTARHSELLDSYRRLVSAYIALASLHDLGGKLRYSELEKHPDADKQNSTADEFMKKAKIANLKKLFEGRDLKSAPRPCILTKPPKIQYNADYGNVGYEAPEGSDLIKGFTDTFEVMKSGLSKPKIVFCRGKSKKYKQLVKGRDDLKGDKLIMEVFEWVNGLMNRAGMSQLQLRTFQCVPMSPTSGILEFVQDTISLKTYETAAHDRYYPGEWGYNVCRSQFGKSPKDLRRQTFDKICENYSPCFRFFFTEYFWYSTQAWHAAKMIYIRSVAIYSMVGHILGIGDRHLENILIDTKTGGLVHIDFGIVFGQAKLQATPEMVPFRLTRSTVDGMGPCGTEGTFTRSCEITMRILRANRNTLHTILGAIVADPLFKFSLSPAEARRRQQVGEEGIKEENLEDDEAEAAPEPDKRAKESERALAQILAKLEGREEGSAERHSVEGQVQMLINSARDRTNLSNIFLGWSPWV